MPIETRGVVAQWDRRDGSLTTWNSTQVSHFVQQGLAPALGLPHQKIRVIAPDLGGGFGTKAAGYPEDVLIPLVAMVLNRPVKWIEGPARAHDGGGPRPSPDPRDRAGGGARRHDAGRPRSHLARPRRLQLLGHRTALQHGGPPDRPAPHPQPPGRRPGCGHQQDAQRAVPGRRTARDGVRHGPHRRLSGPQARDGPGRAAPAQLHPARRDAVGSRHALSRRQPARLRQRRLPRRPGGGPQSRGLRRVPR